MTRLRSVAVDRLEEALRQPGCPACAEMERVTSRYLHALLREHTSGDGVWERVQRTWGLCRQHTRGLLAEEPEPTPGVNTAALYRWLAEAMLAQAGWGKSRAVRLTAAEMRALLKPEGMCLACEQLGEYQRAIVHGLVSALESNNPPLVRETYFRGAGLCLPHLRLALSAVEDRQIATSLARHFLGGIHALAVDLGAFLNAVNATTASSTPASSDPCRRAVERFTGRLGS